MAIKSMIRLNQIKEQLGDFAKTADLATGYSHGGEGKNGLEETLSKLGESLHKRFGTDAVGTSGLHPDNAKGVVASFSSDDAANITIHTKNTANTISLLAGDSSADSGYLDLSNTVADLGTENSFVKVDDASIGQMFVASKYEMKIDKTNEIALFGLDDLVLDMDGSGADGLIKLYSAETFIELTDDKSVKIGFNTNYPDAKMHVDPGAHISQLKLAANDGIAITGSSHASGQQVFISSGVNEALLLDAGSMSKLSSGINNYAQLSSTASVLAALHAGSNKTAQFTASNDAAAKATMTSDSAAADHYISVDRTGDG